MYERFFFLRENPFHITPDTRFLYLGRMHREAMDLFSYGIRERKGFILLTGEVGAGKTTLCRAMLERLPPGTGSALILNPLLSDFELLKAITQDFGLCSEGDTVKGHLDCLNRFLLERASKGGNAVVIIDEAQHLSPAALEMVRMLSNLETEREKLLQIALVGQPELRDRLVEPGLKQLNQRVIIRHHLVPLDLAETGAYIENRLAVAGGRGCVEFTPEALSLIHRGSSGIPRMINIVADRSLTAAFIAEKRLVDRHIAARAVGELEADGYIRPTDGWSYLRYAPFIAASSFAASFAAGIYWGPILLRIASLR